MKYYEKRKHLITKILIALIIATALFFALCDCAPKTTSQQITITFGQE